MNLTKNTFLILIGLLISLVACSQNISKVASPESVGINSETLKLAESKMQGFIDDGKLAGISTMVIKDGKIIQRANFGFAHIEDQKPIEDNTIYRIYSMTKPITAVALMTLYDEGKFKLDDKVSKYITEFKDTKVYQKDETSFKLVPQKEDVTIRHLLTHTSGISYGWSRSYVDSLYRATGASGWDGVIGDKVKILAGLPLNFQPGTKWQYGLSIDVAGYLVEVLSGTPLDEYLKTKIFDPLNMDDTGFYVPEEKHDRLSDVFRINYSGELKGAQGAFKNAYKSPTTLFSGGGGLVSTMDNYKRFCMMLLNDGELEGKRILSNKAVKLMMTNQLPSEVKHNTGYGLGGAVNIKTKEYFWSGAASTNFWIDQKNDMIIMTYAQLMPSNQAYAKEFRNLVRRAMTEK